MTLIRRGGPLRRKSSSFKYIVFVLNRNLYRLNEFRLIVVIRNSKNIFLRCKMMIGFLIRGINLIFSKTKEGDNNVFSPLCYENDLNIGKNFI